MASRSLPRSIASILGVPSRLAAALLATSGCMPGMVTADDSTCVDAPTGDCSGGSGGAGGGGSGGSAGAAGGGGCVAESNGALCQRFGYTCGEVTELDNCGDERTVPSCGGCSAPQTCGGDGVPFQCGSANPCATHSCAAHATCSAATGTAACTCNPGYVGDGQTCTAAPDPCATAGACPEGTWVNVTAPGIDLNHDIPSPAQNFGVQDVLVDPARPSDIYAFVCYQGVWRSQDYGFTWTKVSTGDNSDGLEAGRPWTAAIDPNPNRDPNTPPTLITVSGYSGITGLFKSTDWGVNWTFIPTTLDLYSMDVDPYDGQHIITGTHETNDLAESTDGGETWTYLDIPDQMGVSIYPFFVDTGDPVTTAQTWVTIAQADCPAAYGCGGLGVWRTDTQGATWTQVEGLEHGHGNAQMHRAGPGIIYAAGVYGWEGWGVYRSVDAGLTWHSLVEGNWGVSGVVGTPNYLYAWSGLGTRLMMRAAINPGTGWTTQELPPDMHSTGKRAAVTFDGTRHIVIMGSWLAGIWRYAEVP